MRRGNSDPWPVTNDHITPAGPPDACCWCKAKLGQQHKPSCAVCQRTVVCDVTIRLVRLVTEGWKPDEIEYDMNSARWCATNILGELDKLAAHAEHTASGCLCEFFTGRYVREATTEDEDQFGVWVEREREQRRKSADVGNEEMDSLLGGLRSDVSAEEIGAGWERIAQAYVLGQRTDSDNQT